MQQAIPSPIDDSLAGAREVAEPGRDQMSTLTEIHA